MALKYLFDRAADPQRVYRDFAIIGNDQPIDPSNRYYNADLPQRPFDPDKAKFHLQKSGVGGAQAPDHCVAGGGQLGGYGAAAAAVRREDRAQSRRQAGAG